MRRAYVLGEIRHRRMERRLGRGRRVCVADRYGGDWFGCGMRRATAIALWPVKGSRGVGRGVRGRGASGEVLCPRGRGRPLLRGLAGRFWLTSQPFRRRGRGPRGGGGRRLDASRNPSAENNPVSVPGSQRQNCVKSSGLSHPTAVDQLSGDSPWLERSLRSPEAAEALGVRWA